MKLYLLGTESCISKYIIFSLHDHVDVFVHITFWKMCGEISLRKLIWPKNEEHLKYSLCKTNHGKKLFQPNHAAALETCMTFLPK